MALKARIACTILVFLAAAGGVVPATAQTRPGRIDGRLSLEDGRGVAGATVLINETSAVTLTGAQGNFVFDGVPPGTYALTITLGTRTLTVPGIVIVPGESARVSETVDWGTGFTDTLVVTAASRRLERIVDAPASATRVTEAEIAERAAHGQLPKLLEFAPGVELTQSGLYDFNFNTRGFNSTLNRRVAVLIDGRDPSDPFSGAQEWAALSSPLDDLASIELVRGPSAALYGANASSGILDIVSKEPRFSPGGIVRASFGQLGTQHVDFQWAGSLGRGWYAKTVGGVRHSGDFAVSRRGAAEYSRPCAPGEARDCLPQEVVPFARINDNRILFGGLRFDKYLDGGMRFTVEGGLSDIAGPLIQTGIGRGQTLEARRPWARVNLASGRFNAFAAYSGRDAPRQLGLSSGIASALDSRRLQFEGQTNWRFRGDRVRLVLGGSVVLEHIDSFDPVRNVQTVVFEPIDTNQEAVFSQMTWRLADAVTVVVAGRGDVSSRHDPRFSPKASLVYTPRERHSLRLTFNQAFQVGNYSELFLHVDAAPPVNLSALNGLCLPFGVDCGFGPTRVLAVGNGDLELETIRTWELGYKGVLADRAFLTVDYHKSEASNFITDLLPQLGTSLGRINPGFSAWRAPDRLPEAAAAQIRALAPATLSNDRDGAPVLVVASYTNFGRVSTQGVDTALRAVLPAGWSAAASYSWFDFTLRDEAPRLDGLLTPNAPAHSITLGTGYERGRLAASLSLRWVDAFRWSVGAFQGNVESYTTADAVGSYELTRRVAIGANVSNLFDDEHWESFGGDLLGRRALVSLQYRW